METTIMDVPKFEFFSRTCSDVKLLLTAFPQVMELGFELQVSYSEFQSNTVGALIPNAFGFQMVQSHSDDEWFGF